MAMRSKHPKRRESFISISGLEVDLAVAKEDVRKSVGQSPVVCTFDVAESDLQELQISTGSRWPRDVYVEVDQV